MLKMKYTKTESGNVVCDLVLDRGATACGRYSSRPIALLVKPGNAVGQYKGDPWRTVFSGESHKECQTQTLREAKSVVEERILDVFDVMPWAKEG